MEVIVSMNIKFFDDNVEKLITSFEEPTIARVLRILDLLEIFGNRLGLPHSKKIEKNLFELRIRGKQEVRIFYTFHKGEVVLLHGFVKKSQRIPQKELGTARHKIYSLDKK